MALQPWMPICDWFYGTFASGIGIRECGNALGKMAMTPTSEVYEINAARPMGPYNLPITYTDDRSRCAITVEIAGPKLPRYITVSPRSLYQEAQHIIETCVTKSTLFCNGGFSTWPLEKLRRHVTDLSVNLDDAYPVDTSFLTVTIHRTDLKHPSPGNYDYRIADTLEWFSRDQAQRTSDRDRESLLLSRAERWHLNSERMQPHGRKVNWWRDPYESTSSARNGTIHGTKSVLPLPYHSRDSTVSRRLR